jgi:hypothetical protein
MTTFVKTLVYGQTLIKNLTYRIVSSVIVYLCFSPFVVTQITVKHSLLAMNQQDLPLVTSR